MKKIIAVLFITIFIIPSLAMAAAVGGPELSIPEKSMFLKEKVVRETLDRHESMNNIKTGLDVEIVSKRELTSADDVSEAEIEGHNFMLKFSNNFYDVFEPYIKIGTSTLEVDWVQRGNNIRVESETGLAWGAGAKAKLWDFQDWGVKLTLDVQYRHTDLDVDKAKIGGSISAAAAKGENFEINEWQISLLGSKKLIIPMGKNDYYVVPYGGLTHSMLNADICFTHSPTGGLYSTYDASDENEFGLVAGFDIMPFYLSHYLLNFELRLINEYAFSLGGTIKF